MRHAPRSGVPLARVRRGGSRVSGRAAMRPPGPFCAAAKRRSTASAGIDQPRPSLRAPEKRPPSTHCRTVDGARWSAAARLATVYATGGGVTSLLAASPSLSRRRTAAAAASSARASSWSAVTFARPPPERERQLASFVQRSSLPAARPQQGRCQSRMASCTRAPFFAQPGAPGPPTPCATTALAPGTGLPGRPARLRARGIWGRGRGGSCALLHGCPSHRIRVRSHPRRYPRLALY